MGRLVGDDTPGWGAYEWLLLDVRNAVESIRVMTLAQSSSKKIDGAKEYREWTSYPGYEREKRRRTKKKLEGLRHLLEINGGVISG